MGQCLTMCGHCLECRARAALAKAILRAGIAHGPQEGECGTRVEQGMRKALAFPSLFTGHKIGNPAQWLPPKARKEVEEAETKRLKSCIKNPLALAKAKDAAGISDAAARTFLLDMMPDRSWVPSGQKLVQARKECNDIVQVREHHFARRSFVQLPRVHVTQLYSVISDKCIFIVIPATAEHPSHMAMPWWQGTFCFTDSTSAATTAHFHWEAAGEAS